MGGCGVGVRRRGRGVGVGLGALGVGVGLGLGMVVAWGVPVGAGPGVLEAEEAIAVGTEASVLGAEAIVLGAEAIVLGTEAIVSEGTTACWGCGPCAIETTPTVVIATSTAATTPVTIAFLAVTGPPNRSKAGLSSSRQLVISVPITKKTMPTINTIHIL